MTLNGVEHHVEVIHTKGIWHLVRLVPKEDGNVIKFGVIKGNEMKMVGTKAEAKKYYGKDR